LKLLKEPGVYEQLEEKRDKLTAGMTEAAAASKVDTYRTEIGSMFCTFFSSEPVKDFAGASRSDQEQFKVFFRELLCCGVYIAPAQFECGFVSLAHSDKDLEETVAVSEKAFAAVRKYIDGEKESSKLISKLWKAGS